MDGAASNVNADGIKDELCELGIGLEKRFKPSADARQLKLNGVRWRTHRAISLLSGKRRASSDFAAGGTGGTNGVNGVIADAGGSSLCKGPGDNRSSFRLFKLYSSPMNHVLQK